MLLLALFVFSSCGSDSADDSSARAEPQSGGGSTPAQESENNSPQNPSDSDEPFVTLLNASDFAVWVYADPARTDCVGTIPQGESLSLSAEPSVAGTVYYLSYRVNIGIEIPWSDATSFVIAAPQKGKTVTVNIENPSAMRTNDAFLLVQNASGGGIIVRQGASTELFAFEKSFSILNAGECGVYRFSRASFASFSQLKIITEQGNDIPLPENFMAIESGNIYAVTVTNGGSSLKSVTPFDIDTQRQIWSFSDADFDPNFPIILRPARSVLDGSLIMGTLAGDNLCVGVKEIDRYNENATLRSAKISHSSAVTTTKSTVLDFAQRADGAIVVLLQNEYVADAQTKTAQFVVCYDFVARSVKWSYEFPEEMLFRADSKNKLICTDDGKTAVAGSLIAGNEMHRYFAVFSEAADGNSVTVARFVSDDFTDLSQGIETQFTSACYDGGVFYVCGYGNCDFLYSERVYRGIVCSFSADLSECAELYSCERALFFCIDGTGSDWYACGEFADTGRILKGCFLSSRMAAAHEQPALFSLSSAGRAYCYFSNLCCYDSKIVVAGKASDDFAGGENPLPVIVAFDRAAQSVLWENTGFSAYTDVGAVVPNAINTYIAQLFSASTVHYVSADLLGGEK